MEIVSVGRVDLTAVGSAVVEKETEVDLEETEEDTRWTHGNLQY